MIKTPFFAKLATFSVVLLLVSNCAKTDPVTGEKVLIDPNADRKATAFRDQGGGIFGSIGAGNKNTNFEFASSNVLWRATLKSLDFLPLLIADYNGGIITYDWY